MIRQFDQMPVAKQRAILKLRDELNDMRPRLDGIMYGSLDPLPAETYQDLRKFYDAICKAIEVVGL